MYNTPPRGEVGRGSWYVLDKRLSHWSECIDEHAVLEALAAMYDVWFFHEHVAGADYLGDTVDGEFERTALYVGNLAVRVAVEVADGPRLELHLDNHEVVVVGHDFAVHLAWIGGALPLYLVVEYEIVTLDGDRQSLDHLYLLIVSIVAHFLSFIGPFYDLLHINTRANI